MTNSNVPAIKIKFYSPDPMSPDLLFVEVENMGGKSVTIGKWEVEDNRYETLTITSQDIEALYEVKKG